MIEETLPKEAQYLARALPLYMTAQGTMLLFTALDVPIYTELYRANHFFTVSGWVGAWFVLVIFGLANAVFLLAHKSWRILFDERARAKLSLSYFLGSLTGLLTLGVRFIPIIAPQYFLWVGVFALLSIGAYLVWKKRVQRMEELFP